MKNLKLILVFVTTIVITGLANAQSDCKWFFPVDQGTELTYNSFNGKDKLQSIDYFTVSSMVETATRTTIKIKTKTTDKKGNDPIESEMEFYCEAGVFHMELKSFVTEEMTKDMQDAQITMEQDGLEIPSNIKVGQALPDAKMTVTIVAGIKMKITVVVTDRKVEANESMTTAAGTFDTFKISQTMTSTFTGISSTYTSTDWFAENVGSVRSETYNKNGKLENYRVLTNIKR